MLATEFAEYPTSLVFGAELRFGLLGENANSHNQLIPALDRFDVCEPLSPMNRNQSYDVLHSNHPG